MKTCLFQGPVFVCLLVIISVVSRLHADDEKAAELTIQKEQAAELDEDQLELRKSIDEVKPSKDSTPADVNDSTPNDVINPLLGGQDGINHDLKRIQGMGVYVVETEDGMAAYSESLGKWDRIKAGPRTDGKPILSGCTVGIGAIASIVNDELFGFCGDSGKWNKQSVAGEDRAKTWYTLGKGMVTAANQVEVYGMNAKSKRWSVLTIPEEYRGKTVPIVGNHFAEVRIGNKTFVLSSSTGEWISPDDAEQRKSEFKNSFAPSTATPTRSSSLSTVDSDLSNRIAQHEANAAIAASKLRNLPKDIDNGHPTAIEARLELDHELATALDLRFEREELQAKELRFRINRLEQQITQRKAQRSAILERRRDELINGDVLEWDEASNVPAKGDSETSHPTSSDPLATPSGKPQLKNRSRSAVHRIPSGRKASTLVATEKPTSETNELAVDDLLTKLKDAQDAVAELKANISKLESSQTQVDNHDDAKSQLDLAKQQLELATKRQLLLAEQIEASGRELDLQMKEAELEMNEATIQLQTRINSAEEITTESPAYKTNYMRMARAQQAIERLKKRQRTLELAKQKQVDRLSSDVSVPRSTTVAVREDLNIQLPSALEDPEARSTYLWKVLGMKFDAPLSSGDADLKGTRHRAGLRITEVNPTGAAAIGGIRKGDVLVGLDKWETAATRNVVWILDRWLNESKTKESTSLIQGKFIIIRKNEERFGQITFIRPTVTMNLASPLTRD